MSSGEEQLLLVGEPGVGTTLKVGVSAQFSFELGQAGDVPADVFASCLQAYAELVAELADGGATGAGLGWVGQTLISQTDFG